MKTIKIIIELILNKISLVIFYIIPSGFRPKLELIKILDEELNRTTFKIFGNHLKKSILFKGSLSGLQIRKYAVEKALFNDAEKKYFYLEFGVFKGESANFFSKYLNKLYAFDSFEGLKEDWGGTVGLSKSSFNNNKKIPKLNNNVIPVVGWVEDTLDKFLKEKKPKINFVNMDLDTYNATKFVLKKIKPYLVKDATIIFDELYNYYGFEEGEYKALLEIFDKDEFAYKAFEISDQKYGSKVVIQVK